MVMREKRERARAKGTASERGRKQGGGLEGSGGGDGEADGKKTSEQCGLAEGGQSFAFGQVPEKQKASVGASPRDKSSAPKLSYRDKLLSPGCAGFLVKHSEDDDIV